MAKTYLDLAEDFIDKEDYDSAVEILQKGLDATGDKDISKKLEQVLLDQVEKEAPMAPSTLNGLDTFAEIKKEAKLPDEKQIALDITTAAANCFNLNYTDVFLDIASVSIDRRRTEGIYDEVYASVALENDLYAVNANYTLNYSLYDVGGWQLDNIICTDYQSYATRPLIDEATFLDFCSNTFTTTEITSRNHGLDENTIYYDQISFSSTISSTYITNVISGTYVMEFYDDYWHESCIINPVTWNPFAFCGIWEYNHYDEYIWVNIMDFNETETGWLTVSYNHATSSWPGYFNDHHTDMQQNNGSATGEVKPTFTQVSFCENTFDCLTAIDGFLRIPVAGYSDYDAAFKVRFDSENGLYIDDLLFNYKTPGSEASWDLSGSKDIYIPKITN